MTANQISYAKLLEEKRHNVAYETETNRHNVETEGIGWHQAESSRIQANASTVQAQASMINAYANSASVQEAIRHDQVSESLQTTEVSSKSLLNKAQTKYYNSKSKYAGQENARSWINSISGGVGNILKGIGSILPG